MPKLLAHSRASSRPVLKGMVWGALAAGLFTLPKLLFIQSIGEPSPFLLYFAAIMFAAYQGGISAGLGTTLICAILSVVFFIGEPVAPLWSRTGFMLLVFCIEGVAISFVTDRFVSERTRTVLALDKLGATRDKLDLVLRGTDEGITLQDGSGKLVYANQLAAELTGCSSPRELLELAPQVLAERFEMFDQDGQPFSFEDLPGRALLRCDSANEVLVRFRVRGTSEDRWSAIRASAVKDEHGSVRFVVNLFRDVTEKRAIERRSAFLASATRELNSSLDYKATLATVTRLAVPSMADWCAVDILEEGKLERLAVAHVDPDKVELVEQVRQSYPANPEAPGGVHAILKRGEPEMISELPREFIESAAHDPEHRRLLEQLDLRSYIGVPLQHEGNTFGVITMVMAESGRLYTKEDLELAQSLADRAALAVTNAHLYQQTARARNQAVLASRTKDEFFAMLGHELRNPLAPIQTALDLMRLRSRGQEPAELRVIERQVKHLVRLVDDLLDVSRIAHNRVDLEKKRVDLKHVVERALEIVWPTSLERAHSVHLDLDPEVVVLGDTIRLAQIVANLLSNSIKYTPPGGNIWVQASRDGDDARLSVRDDGSGIGPDTLPHVFDMFVQEPQALNRARGGLGLGLAIVRSLILAHGGSVSAHSDGPGKGSEFLIELPLSLGTAVSPSQHPPSMARRNSAERVLVVDDNHDARELLARLLAQLGHSAWTAADGLDAIAIAAAQRPTLALLDIGLPGMDGYEVAERLRSLHGLGHLRLVAVTGYGQLVDRARSKHAGFVAHIVKPLSLEALTDLVGTPTGDAVQTTS